MLTEVIMPTIDKPIDPRPTLAALLGAYISNAYGGGPPDAGEKIADAFAKAHATTAEHLRKWLVGDGNASAACMYMARCHNWAQGYGLGAQPRPGQVGGAAIALRLLRHAADSMLRPSGTAP
jgi:hypothetical protein